METETRYPSVPTNTTSTTLDNSGWPWKREKKLVEHAHLNADRHFPSLFQPLSRSSCPPPPLSFSVFLSSSCSLERFCPDLSPALRLVTSIRSKPIDQNVVKNSCKAWLIKMLSKTAVRGGKLRSCHKLWKYFLPENPRLWLSAMIMVMVTLCRPCPSVQDLNYENQSCDARCQVT